MGLDQALFVSWAACSGLSLCVWIRPRSRCKTDQNRFSYFLDFLSHHAQAHKLLFWFEIEQFKLLAGDDRVRRKDGPDRKAAKLDSSARRPVSLRTRSTLVREAELSHHA